MMRIHVALFLGCVGAVNGALGIFYPSALWWGEDQLQAVLTRGCEEYTEMSDCVPLRLPHWYEKLQSSAAVHASPGLPMSAQAMVGLGIVKLVMISLCEAGGFVGGAIYPAFLAGSFGSALGATPWIQSLGGQFVYLSTAAAMSTALSALLNTQLFGVLLVLVLQDNIPHGNVSSQIIALLTAVYVHYLLTRKCIPSQLRLMPSQKDGFSARQDVIYSDISVSRLHLLPFGPFERKIDSDSEFTWSRAFEEALVTLEVHVAPRRVRMDVAREVRIKALALALLAARQSGRRDETKCMAHVFKRGDSTADIDPESQSNTEELEDDIEWFPGDIVTLGRNGPKKRSNTFESIVGPRDPSGASVVVAGLCFNLLLAVRFLSGSQKPQKTSDPKAARRVTLPVGRGFREEQNGRGKLEELEPGKMPSLDRFPPEELGSNVPSHWEYLLPGRCESERLKCRELRERVRHVEGAKDMVTMLRFLRARRGRVDDAAKMWRRQTGYELGFRMNTRNDWLHRKVDSCWPPTAMLGKDLDGDPVYWNRLEPEDRKTLESRGALLFASLFAFRMGLGSMDFLEQVPTEFLIQHEVYTITRIMQALEEASRLSSRPVMYFTVVTDLGEMSKLAANLHNLMLCIQSVLLEAKFQGLRNFNIKGIMKYKVCVRILEDHFPEIVKRIIAIRVPRIAYTLWNIASHFFDEGTRNKIQIADPQNTLAVLSQFMDPKPWAALIESEKAGMHRSASTLPLLAAPLRWLVRALHTQSDRPSI
ncbi:retm [Symbiodinium sp. CCMP2592]|nr:retm [Symbiodinium sp. CCMP2592]